jgi:hypothetical protein
MSGALLLLSPILPPRLRPVLRKPDHVPAIVFRKRRLASAHILPSNPDRHGNLGTVWPRDDGVSVFDNDVERLVDELGTQGRLSISATATEAAPGGRSPNPQLRTFGKPAHKTKVAQLTSINSTLFVGSLA